MSQEENTMMTFKVTITETLQREVTVKAGSREEAELTVKGRWNYEEYVLDSSDFVRVDFKAEPIRRERGYER
jgi:hypothetical protein